MTTFIDNLDRKPRMIQGTVVTVLDTGAKTPRWRVSKATVRRCLRFKVGDRIMNSIHDDPDVSGVIEKIITSPTGASLLDIEGRVSVADDHDIYGLFMVNWNGSKCSNVNRSPRRLTCGHYIKKVKNHK